MVHVAKASGITSMGLGHFLSAVYLNTVCVYLSLPHYKHSFTFISVLWINPDLRLYAEYRIMLEFLCITAI